MRSGRRLLSTTACGRRLFSTTACGHPLIDVVALNRGCRNSVKALRSALYDHGYFYAANVDALSQSYIQSIHEYSRRAHALPAGAKEAYLQRGGTGAYSGPDVGQPELNYDGSEKAATVCGWDYSRTRFSLGNADDSAPERYDDPASDPRYPPASLLEPAFAVVLDELYHRQNGLSRILLSGMEAALDLPERVLRDLFDGGGDGDFGTVRLLHYPGGGDQDGSDGKPGIGAHTDFECFTLMHQDAAGLQLMPRTPGGGHGGWIDAPVRPAEFVVIIGDMLERLTNGALLATPHRVLQTPHPRSSIIRFNAFAPEATIAPLAQFVSEERPARYTPVRMRTHMETTMRNLEAGLGSWDVHTQRSISATYKY